jgi:hypothetical protein
MEGNNASEMQLSCTVAMQELQCRPAHVTSHRNGNIFSGFGELYSS